MNKEELLKEIRNSKKGIIYLKNDLKVIFEDSKELAKKENREYEYSKVYSLVYDGQDEVKFTYTERPSTNISSDHDPLKEYTDFKYKTLTLSEINKLTFVD